MAGYRPLHSDAPLSHLGRTDQRTRGLTHPVDAVIPWSPRRRAAIGPGRAEPLASYERCWAEGASGQQCDAVIDSDDLLGLCESHRTRLRG
jgi:hypothetical protein